MDEATTLKTLHLFYAASLVDAVRQDDRHGILDAVIEGKRREQELSAPEQLKRLGITKARDIFETYNKLFGCAAWTFRENGVELRAETTSCLACALAKKMVVKAPCSISCINPVRAQAAALQPAQRLTVEKTLWESDSCVFVMNPIKAP